MKRPALYSLLFLALGILGKYFIFSSFVVIFYFILNGLLIYKWCSAKEKRTHMIIYILFFLLGFFLMGLRMAPGSSIGESIALSGEEAVIKGVIIQSEKLKSGRQEIILKTSSVENSIQTTRDRMTLLIYLNWEEELIPGREIVISGKLLKPEPQRNPGGFDEYLYYKTRKLDYKVYGYMLHQGKLSIGINTVFYYISYRIGAVYNHILPQREAGIAKALILGDKRGLDSYIKYLYKDAGVYHIVAISGLHISLIAEFLKRVFSKIAGFSKGLILSSLLIVVYCLFTGASVSTVRAVSMALISAGAFFLRRDYDLLSSAAFTAVLLLIYEPFYLFDAGFQLSFSCVFGIGVLYNPIKFSITKIKFYREKYKFAAESIAVSLAASIASLPVMIMHFYYIPVYSVIVNLFVVPFCSIVVALGFITGILGLLSMEAALIFAAPFYFILKYFEGICLFFTSLPGATVFLGYQPIILMILYYIMVLALAGRRWNRGGNLLAVSMLAGVFIIWNVLPAPFSVTMLDVGQGDCIVIEKGREVYIIDGGGWYGGNLTNNTGSNVLGPYLEYRGITNVSAAFITHLDSDHYTGIYELIQLKNVEKIILPITADRESEDYKLILDTAEKYNTKIEFFESGCILEGDSQIKFETLYPFMYNSSKDINESSLVLMLHYNNFKMLFMADAGFDTESNISNQNIQAHILKAGHHGSRYSTGSPFLEAVSPAVVFISAGQNNIYGHPHEEVLQRIEEREGAVYLTADTGAVILKYKKGRIIIRTMIQRP